MPCDLGLSASDTERALPMLGGVSQTALNMSHIRSNVVLKKIALRGLLWAASRLQRIPVRFVLPRRAQPSNSH